jgi:hypothetical protein
MPEKKPRNRPVGYARVSTVGQTLAAQLEQLRKAGCSQIFREKVTGARAAHGPPAEPHAAAAEGSTATASRRGTLKELAKKSYNVGLATISRLAG